MSILISHGVNNILKYYLLPNRTPISQLAFPRNIPLNGVYFHQNESVKGWLSRCVSDFLDGDINKCKIADNIGVFIEIHWSSSSEIEMLSIQTIVALSGTLERYLALQNQQFQYFRIDLDNRNLGTVFGHHFPHIHVNQMRHGPRLAFGDIPSQNIVADYFDYLYRCYVPEEWADWAKTVWRQRSNPIYRSRTDALFDDFDTAFRNRTINSLLAAGVYPHAIQDFKRSLREEKDTSYRPRANRILTELISYNI
jgi:hypothetical protein